MKQEAESYEERLKQLSGSGKEFKVPANYFEELPDRISKMVQDPDFESEPAVNPFRTPDGYFHRLPIEVSDRITSGARVPSYRPFPRLASLALASIIIAACVLFIVKVQHYNPTRSQITLEDIRKSNYLYAIDEDLIVDAYMNVEKTSTNESIEQYLIDNNIDISQIEKAL